MYLGDGLVKITLLYVSIYSPWGIQRVDIKADALDKAIRHFLETITKPQFFCSLAMIHEIQCTSTCI